MTDDELKKMDDIKDLLNENLNYMNELAKRILLIADALLVFSKRIKILEEKNE